MFFFFKQKTAYEMRISDWSSDVCSSDLSSTLARRSRPSSASWPAPWWSPCRRLPAGCTTGKSRTLHDPGCSARHHVARLTGDAGIDVVDELVAAGPHRPPSRPCPVGRPEEVGQPGGAACREGSCE